MDCNDIRVEEIRQVMSMVPDDGKLATLTRTEFEQVVSAAYSCGQMSMALAALDGDEQAVRIGAICCAIFKNDMLCMIGLVRHYLLEREPNRCDAGGRHD